MEHSRQYILSVDQSTQGTKAMVFDADGRMLCRRDLPHRQIVDGRGWVEHDLSEIWENTKGAVRAAVEAVGIAPREIAAMGISNQRETVAAWNRRTGEPVHNAIVWQCARGEEICTEIKKRGYGDLVKARTGLDLSPYFSASKLAWLLQNVPEAARLAREGLLCCGTIDSWLVYKLTGGKEFKTDYSNASRTQLFHIGELRWDQELCGIFGVPEDCLPHVCDSDARFGETDLDGFFETPVPVCAVLGDSHGALYGQGCHEPGMTKATYGTGSSVMMNVGEKPVFSREGLVTSLAWGCGGKVQYVLEGNINYTGAVITWLERQLGLVGSAAETEELARRANPNDRTYLVPAFSGLGAPYWDSSATATITGMTRVTGKAELVRAALDCIAYQIGDIVGLMDETLRRQGGHGLKALRVDGGPTRNRYLMQFQSDILGIPVEVPADEELSGIGAAYLAGIRAGVYEKEKVFGARKTVRYVPEMEKGEQKERREGWKRAVARARGGE